MKARWISGVAIVNIIFWIGSYLAYSSVDSIVRDSHNRVMSAGLDSAISELNERYPEELPPPGSVLLAQIMRRHASDLGETSRMNVVQRKGGACQVVNQSFIKEINDSKGVIPCTKLMLEAFLLGESDSYHSKSFYGEDVHSNLRRIQRFLKTSGDKRSYVLITETFTSEVRGEVNKLFFKIIVGVIGVFVLSVGFGWWGYKKARQQRKTAMENKATLQNVTSGIIRVNADREIVSISPYMLDMFGYEEESEIVGRCANMLFPEEHLEKDISSFNRLYLGQGTDEDRKITLEGKRKDGTQFPLKITRQIVNFPEGWQMLKVLDDLTDEYAQRARIERQVASMKRIGYMFRHDVANHMTPVQTAINFMKKTGKYSDKAISLASRESTNALMLLKSLSEQSRLAEQDIQDLVIESIDLNKLISDVKPEGIKLEMSDMGSIECNTGLLQSAYRNMFENAQKYAEVDPVAKVYREGDDLIFEDNAGGFACVDGQYDQKEADRMMSPRERGRVDVPGSGLGLFNIKTSVETHGWTFHHESKCGKSTKWIIKTK